MQGHQQQQYQMPMGNMNGSYDPRFYMASSVGPSSILYAPEYFQHADTKSGGLTEFYLDGKHLSNEEWTNLSPEDRIRVVEKTNDIVSTVANRPVESLVAAPVAATAAVTGATVKMTAATIQNIMEWVMGFLFFALLITAFVLSILAFVDVDNLQTSRQKGRLARTVLANWTFTGSSPSTTEVGLQFPLAPGGEGMPSAFINAPASGILKHLTAQISSGISAGSIVLTATKNGEPIKLSATYDPTSTETFILATPSCGCINFCKGDRLGIQMTSSGATMTTATFGISAQLWAQIGKDC